MSLFSYLQSAMIQLKSIANARTFNVSLLKCRDLKLKFSQELVPPLSERIERINREFNGCMGGQEFMKDESH
jgi:hypothetical protein